jgi:hypothetical protein
MLKSQVTKPELTYCVISLAIIDVFSGDELIQVARGIATLTDLKHDRSLEDYSTDEIRVLLMDRLRELYEKQPEMLTTVESIIEHTAANTPASS